MLEYYKHRFPLSQHPNMLQVQYPTTIRKNEYVEYVAQVCEHLEDDVCTLRDWIDPINGYIYLGDSEHIAQKHANVFVQLAAILLTLHNKNNLHGCISPYASLMLEISS